MTKEEPSYYVVDGKWPPVIKTAAATAGGGGGGGGGTNRGRPRLR